MADHEAGTHRAEARIGLEGEAFTGREKKAAGILPGTGYNAGAKARAEIAARKAALNKTPIAPPTVDQSTDFSEAGAGTPEGNLTYKYRYEDQDPTGE